METVNWKVDGMTCANCALTINKYLEKKGASNVRVSLASGDVSFDAGQELNTDELAKGIGSLGYQVMRHEHTDGHDHGNARPMNKYLRYLLLCLPFTLVLMLHMLHTWVHLPWLMNGWVQFALCLPVYGIGMYALGPSAWHSVLNRMPNMNVLIVLGATAALVYSLVGTIGHLGDDYLFYETTAAIIIFVFFGNYLESVSIHSTQKALNSLARNQQVMANMIAFDDQHQEQVFPVESKSLRNGDLVLIKSGEQVPADARILWGEASVDESILTGEGLPVRKKIKDQLLGGSLIADGTVKAQVTAAAGESVLARIVNLVKQAQGEKPPVQQLADKISAVFVPVVLGIAGLTFLVNYFALHELTPAIMRSVGVLVIACPCAMGLATPAAIAVGLGRAARNGVLFRNAKSLESFKDIRQVVFDKTGTLTTGKFGIAGSAILDPLVPEEEFRRLLFSLEKYSNHPIAKTIALYWKTNDGLRWDSLNEIKGGGIEAQSADGHVYRAGSYAFAGAGYGETNHNIYLSRDGSLTGWVDVKDELRPEAAPVVQWLKDRKIRTILLSGDRRANCETVAAQLGIDEVIAEQTPDQKLEQMARLTAAMPTAMVGDGINDAPALAKATIGISMSDASHIAAQTADVVLMNNGLKQLPLSLGLGKATYSTIKQNLFWAFFYNIIAIPVAAFGLLTPALGALAMGFSDLVLAANSLRLFSKKVA